MRAHDDQRDAATYVDYRGNAFFVGDSTRDVTEYYRLPATPRKHCQRVLGSLLAAIFVPVRLDDDERWPARHFRHDATTSLMQVTSISIYEILIARQKDISLPFMPRRAVRASIRRPVAGADACACRRSRGRR